jgi:hypothetical protein
MFAVSAALWYPSAIAAASAAASIAADTAVVVCMCYHSMQQKTVAPLILSYPQPYFILSKA